MQQKLDEASNNYYTAIDEQKAAEKKVEEAQEKVDQKTREIEGYQESSVPALAICIARQDRVPRT